MKRIIAKQAHYKSLLNTCKRHPGFAEGKAQLQSMINELEASERRISEILYDISRPVSFFYAVKKQAEKEMNREMFRFTSLGEVLAIHKQDETLHLLMKTYQSQLYKVSAYRLYLNAMIVADTLQMVDSNLSGSDFQSRQLPEFRKQTEDFGTQLTVLTDQLLRRKALKKELAALIASTNLLLREGLDYAVTYFKETYPDFYREYMLVRKPHKRKPRTTIKIQPIPGVVNKTAPMPSALPETMPGQKQQAIETLPLIPVSVILPVPIETEEIYSEIETKIPADYLAQVSELISAHIRKAT